MEIEKLLEKYLRAIGKLTPGDKNFCIVKYDLIEEKNIIYCQYGYTNEEVVNSFRNHNFLDEVKIKLTFDKDNLSMNFLIR